RPARDRWFSWLMAQNALHLDFLRRHHPVQVRWVSIRFSVRRRTPQRDRPAKVGERRGGGKLRRRLPRLLRPRSLSDCFAEISARWRRAMAPFFVQIKCQLGKAYEVANRIADAEIASEVYSTAGDYDLLVKFY